MERNEGNVDRALRLAVGIALVVFALGGIIGPWGWVGLVPLLTGLIGFCPLYRVFGWTTCARRGGTSHGGQHD
jgi:hypothetical protein